MNLIYATGRPYGAPLAILRGGATRDPEVKARMREAGFSYDETLHGYRTYLYDDDFAAAIRTIVDGIDGVTVKPKDGTDPLEGLS